ncbi:MAG TPA: hypothetical protein VGL91_00645 [Acidobacteriota bacterium]|jgi:hypothetical protein
MKRALLIPYTFVLMNWAAVAGLYHFLRGHKDIWKTYRVSSLSPKENLAPQWGRR